MTSTTPVEEFSRIFREEHREVRDLLLALIDALADRDAVASRQLLTEVAAATGPHFRYEEEALYPALVELFGEDYIEKLLSDHDLAIANAARVDELVSTGTLSTHEVDEAVTAVRAILPHVSDCEGLSIMVEILPDTVVETIFAARAGARAEGLNLLEWAGSSRSR